MRRVLAIVVVGLLLATLAVAAKRDGQGPGQPAAGPATQPPPQPPPPPRQSTGLVPLSDLKDKYKDQDGGLYGNGFQAGK